MFQLIVAVIGIALVAILAIIAIWVGGIAFSSSSEKAEFAGYFNQGSQIEGALKLYGADIGATPSAANSQAMLELLVENEYLSSVRDAEDWVIEDQSIYRALDPANPGQCRRLNEFVMKDVAALDAAHASWNGCPPCNSVENDPVWTEALASQYDDWPGCRRVEAGDV